MKAIYFLILAVIIMMAGCSSDPSNQESKTMLELEIPSEFDFSMEKNVDLLIELKSNDFEPVKDIVYEIYYVNAQNGNNFLRDMKTDAGGYIAATLHVPSYVSQLYINGFMNSQTLDIVDNSASYYFGPETIVTAPFTTPTATRNFSYMPGIQYDYRGVPYPTDTYSVSPEMLQRIDTSLPESIPLPETHPQYLETGITTNLIVEDSSNVWITFVTEGAGYKNSLGFYTYDQIDGAPDDPAELEHFIVFPNCSLSGSGGGMASGMQIHLGQFGAGTVIGWFLVQNGWQNGVVSETRQRFYSDRQYNPEIPEYNQHNVLLYDAESELFLLAFDDQERPGGDNDFNDAVFFATADPIENINTDNVPPIDIPEDFDEDGVNDPFDDYPNDPERAFDQYYPSQEEHSTIVFEDKWPQYGDYDLNDMVIDYQYHLVTNADNEIKDVNTLFSLRAAGASLDNGFSLLLPFAETNLIIAGSSENIAPELTANTDYAILDLFESTAALTGLQNVFFNTEPDEQYNEPIEFYCELTLSDPVLAENLDFSFPYNPFLRQSGGNSHEIHLMDYSPTERMNTELFMTEDDASDPATGSYYASPLNLPWALNLPESWMYPSEKNSIVEVYFQFAAWAESGGESFQNWYIYDEDNVDVNKVYLTP